DPHAAIGLLRGGRARLRRRPAAKPGKICHGGIVPALRVTFVAPFGLRRKGTTRARVIPLAAALAARGHRVRVVVPAWDSPEDWGRRDRLPGVDVLHLPIRASRCPEFSPTLLAEVWRA